MIESDDISLTNTAVLKEVRLAPRSEWDAYEAATGAQMLEADRLASDDGAVGHGR